MIEFYFKLNYNNNESLIIIYYLTQTIKMSNVAYHRSPCPGRIFEDLGVGFSIGCAGGSMFYFVKG